MLRSIVHLQIITCGLRVEAYLFPNMYHILSASFIDFSFPSWPYTCGSIPRYPMLFHFFICLSICQTTISITVKFIEVVKLLMWTLHHFLLQNCFVYSRPAFSYTSQISLSALSMLELFIKNTGNLYIKLERINILIVNYFSPETWYTSPLFTFLSSQQYFVVFSVRLC